MTRNPIKAYVLGETQTRPASSSDLLCAAQEMTAEDIELSKEILIIEAIRLAPAMTPDEIGRFVAEIGRQMLPSAKRGESS